MVNLPSIDKVLKLAMTVMAVTVTCWVAHLLWSRSVGDGHAKVTAAATTAPAIVPPAPIPPPPIGSCTCSHDNPPTPLPDLAVQAQVFVRTLADQYDAQATALESGEINAARVRDSFKAHAAAFESANTHAMAERMISAGIISDGKGLAGVYRQTAKALRAGK